MENRFRVTAWMLTATVALVVSALVTVLLTSEKHAAGQTQASSFPRTAEGKPDFSGIWEAVNAANWDLLDHSARQGPVIALGAQFSVPAGQGIVEGNEIPYQPAAAAKKIDNMKNAMRLDPEVKCFLPGVPRAMYMPYPFQIVQTPTRILMAFEYAFASRTILMNSKEESPADSWMGWSLGHWEGDALVVSVTDFNADTWFDRAGDFHSDALKVTERYSPLTHDAITYQATVEDPKTFTKPWKITMPLYRRLDKNAQLLEYRCQEFAEPLMFGYLRKR